MNIESIFNDWISSKSTVLDLGCGDGKILSSLQKEKNIQGLGVEINANNIQKCIEKGVNVIEHDIDEGLDAISNNSFDIVLMSQTIQTLNNPLLALEEVTRIGKKCIVTVPNFGHWKRRVDLLMKGQMPKTVSTQESWYSSDNIHLCTLKDFEFLCKELDITIEEKLFMNSSGKIRPYLSFGPNLLSSSGVYRICK
ncbi:MAG: methionine biosynthesis protein MetW [Pseudomonadota bacterium]|nr:methionine biosynthesis protein MetW [Pseudomonadota bacterium]|tara:strand:+ start:72 stop:659 length:588 start_codon:yes stop_codon:yes gene_type:complete